MTDNLKVNVSEKDELKEKAEYVFKIIARFDTYINSTNAKASIILAWNGLVIGTLLLKYGDILSNYKPKYWIVIVAKITLFLMGICSVMSLVFIFRVIYPFLESTSKMETGEILKDESLIFFGAVAKLSASEYYSQVTKQTAEAMVSDLADQAVTLAKGLNIKMEVIRKSVIAIMLQILAILILIVMQLFVF